MIFYCNKNSLGSSFYGSAMHIFRKIAYHDKSISLFRSCIIENVNLELGRKLKSDSN